MKKAEIIERYGEGEYKRRVEQQREYNKAHREEEKARVKKYKETHLEQEKAKEHEQNRKGGKYYDEKLEYMRTGIPSERHTIRNKHNKQYKPYNAIIAPESQIHHEWLPKTAEYTGVALVEADQHMHGFVDVIEILDGKITLLTEEQITNGGV